MYCSNCGNEIKENELYCSKCGEKAVNVIKSEQGDKKKPIKIKFSYCIIGIIIVLVIIGAIIANVSGSNSIINSATTSAKQTSIDTKTSNTTKETSSQEDNHNFPIYIGKTYISTGNDVTYYITFLSSTEYKYVAKYKYGNLPDITMNGTYEIEDDVITTVTSLSGTYIRETYTIVDKNTIKSKSSTYKIDNN